MKQIFPSNLPGSTSNTAARYARLFNGGPWQGSDGATTQHAIIQAGTLRNLRIVLGTAPGAGKSWTFTVLVGGSPTALTVTIADTATAGEITGTDLTTGAGALVSLKCLPGGTPTNFTAGQITIEFEGDDDTTAFYGTCLTNPDWSAANYASILTGAGWTATRTDVEDVLAAAGTLTRLDVSVQNAPNVAGRSLTFVLMKNGVAQDGTSGTPNTSIVLTLTQKTGSATFTLSHAAGDVLVLRCTPVNGPAAGYVAVGLLHQPTTAGLVMMAGRSGTALVSSDTRHWYPVNDGGTGAAPAAESTRTFAIGVSTFSLRGFCVSLTGAPGAGGSGDAYTFTVRENLGSPSGGPSVTIAETATAGADASSTVEIEAADTWDMMTVPGNGPATTPKARWGFAYSLGPTAAAPTVTGIAPDHGSELGGTAVTITGTGFAAGATVLIGGEAATDVVIVSATEITCTTAAHEPATVDVVVTNLDTQFGTLVAGYTYDPLPGQPTLTATPLDYQTIRLEWADVEFETSYELQWGLNGIAYSPLSTPPPGATGATHGGREQLTKYYYRLRAVNAVGTSDWSYADATTPIAPEYHPDSGEDRAGDTIGYVWEEIRNADGVLECYSDIGRAINDPATYYGGRKAPRVARWGQIERALSDFRGLYEGATFSATHTDGDWQFRINHSTKLYAAASVVWRTVSEVARQAKLLARTLVRGIVSEIHPLANREFEIVCADVLSRHFGVGNDERQIPKRTLSRNQFADLPPDLVDKPEPIILGALSDEGSATAPPMLTGLTAEGAYLDEGVWNCGYTPVSGCLASPPSGLSATAVAGGALSVDVPNGEYGLMAVSVDANGVWSDPVPMTNDHANGGSRGRFVSPTPFAEVSAGTQQVNSAWTVGAGAVKTVVILGTYFYGWRPQQMIEVAAPGASCSFTAGPAYGTPGTPDNITPGATIPTWSTLRYYRAVAIMPDGRTGLSQECVAIVRGFRRASRPRWLAVPGAVSYEVYGRSAGYDVDRCWTVDGSPLESYVDDDWLDTGAAIVSGAPAPTGQAPVVFVGTETLGGAVWNRFLVAGHACKAIQGVYQGGVRVSDACFGVTWLVPGKTGWPWGATPYRDIGGRRYTLLYVCGPDGEAAKDGSRPIAVNVLGIENRGDSTGDLVTALPEQELLFLQNFGFGDYQTGAWLASPTFPADPAPENADVVKQIDEDSFSTCAAVLASRVTGGGTGAGMFGAGGEFITLREALARFHVSGGYDCGINRKTQFLVSAFDDRAAALVGVRAFTEAREIDAGSFSIQTVDAEHFNAQPFAHTYDYVRGQWTATGEATDAASVARYGVTRRAEELQLWFVRASALADDLAARAVARTADPPTRCTFQTPAVGFNAELGDLVLVTHSDGIGDGGWTEQPVRVLRHIADPGTLGVTLVGEDVGARMQA